MLDAQDQTWLAIDLDALGVAEARAKDRRVFFGNAGQERVLEAAGVERARAAVITMSNAEAAMSAVAALRKRFPDLPILVRARDPEHMQALIAAGASTVMPELAEASLLLGGAVLQAVGVPADRSDALVAEFRRDHYAGLQR